VLLLTRDSAACTTDTTVRRKQANEMISVVLRCSREKCFPFPGNRKHDTARKHFAARTNLYSRQTLSPTTHLLLRRLDCGETQWVAIDGEHGSLDWQDTVRHVRAAV